MHTRNGAVHRPKRRFDSKSVRVGLRDRAPISKTKAAGTECLTVALHPTPIFLRTRPRARARSGNLGGLRPECACDAPHQNAPPKHPRSSFPNVRHERRKRRRLRTVDRDAIAMRPPLRGETRRLRTPKPSQNGLPMRAIGRADLEQQSHHPEDSKERRVARRLRHPPGSGNCLARFSAGCRRPPEPAAPHRSSSE